MNTYMTENSFGKLGLVPDQSSASDGDGVYGPYRIAYSASGACDYNGWGRPGAPRLASPMPITTT